MNMGTGFYEPRRVRSPSKYVGAHLQVRYRNVPTMDATPSGKINGSNVFSAPR